MIGHRDGHKIVMCDGCYRPKRLGEQGWAHHDEGGFPAATMVEARTRMNGDAIEVIAGSRRTADLAEQGLDYCPDPDCVQAQAEAKVRA